MKLSISNIAWPAEQDEAMYAFLQQEGFCGIEIAPTRIFANKPYDQLKSAEKFAERLRLEYNLTVPSMQSIWYGRSEKIFGSPQERAELISYTKKAIDFAAALGCKNLVFGCPKNRVSSHVEDMEIAVDFFKELGYYALQRNTVLALEPNPVLYGTNFVNTTPEAFELVSLVNCEGFRVNVDLGTILYNQENLEPLVQNLELVHHIHISEPGLAPIGHRQIHAELARLLKKRKYADFVSIEMKNTGDLREVQAAISYIKEVFS